ncbi:MAG: Gfo/Idh/MocA family oxidoreductase [Dehalococcoidia bacterium]|nr:Gfo/Idh/MocA family oxidoreductase [Dehalococcoidia bacterium]
MATGWGIIGLGGWADRIVGPALRQAKDAKLVGVVSRDLARGQKFAKYHGFEHAYDNEAALFANKDVNAIYVATPNNLHAATIVAAAQRGIHSICAVAMAVTEEDCIKMVDACKKANVRLGVDFQTRWHPAFRALKQTITDGTIGEVVTARVQLAGGGAQFRPRQAWRVPNDGFESTPRGVPGARPAGAPPQSGSGDWKHDLSMRGAGVLSGRGMFGTDMLRFLFGDFTEVSASADVETAEHTQETYMLGNIKFKNGVVASYDSAEGQLFPDNSVTAYGTKGTAIATGLQTSHSDGTLEVKTANGRQFREFFGHNMYQDEFEAFMDCIRTGKEPDPSGVDGWRERQMTLALRESAMKRATVKVKL